MERDKNRSGEDMRWRETRTDQGGHEMERVKNRSGEDMR